jgi:hypothetical protein
MLRMDVFLYQWESIYTKWNILLLLMRGELIIFGKKDYDRKRKSLV